MVSNFIVQALRGEHITIYGDGTQTRAFCYVDDMIDGSCAADGRADDAFTGPVNLGNPARDPDRELAERILALTGSRSGSCTARCRRTIRRGAARTFAGAPHAGLGARGVALEDGLARTIAYFDRLLAERGVARAAPIGPDA